MFLDKFLKKLGDVQDENVQMSLLSLMIYGRTAEPLPVHGLSYMSFYREALVYKIIEGEARENETIEGCSVVVCSHLERHPIFAGNKVRMHYEI